MLVRLIRFALLAAALLAGAPVRAETAGDFDFYVLSLSWSPSFCESREGSRENLQCGSARPFAFIVHGLWPQYERGYPEFCSTREPREVPRREIDRVLDIMPSRSLVRHEWEKHGTCSGLRQRSYFNLTRQARERIKIPSEFTRLDDYKVTSPRAVEAAFIAANPGLRPDGIAVTCGDRRLDEVRICLTRDLAFRSCREVDRNACRAAEVVMPPVRSR